MPSVSLLHLDYHPLNVLVHGLEVCAVLDWENVRLGDARFDVARSVAVLSVDPGVLRLRAHLGGPLRAFRRAYLDGYAGAGGRLEGLRPFLAWAGSFLVADLTGRYDDAALRPAQRWTARWALV